MRGEVVGIGACLLIIFAAETDLRMLRAEHFVQADKCTECIIYKELRYLAGHSSVTFSESF